MSVQVLGWVFDHSETTGTARHVLLSLANHADPHGENAWPAIATITREARSSRTQVYDSLRRLRDEGRIRATGHGPNGVVRYTVVMDVALEARLAQGGPESGLPQMGEGVRNPDGGGPRSGPKPSLNRPNDPTTYRKAAQGQPAPATARAASRGSH